MAERTLALEDALAQAERANASKSRFVAAASHDLLQPLSAAKLFLALGRKRRPGSPKPGGDHPPRVRSAFDSVESILGALLDISRLDSGSVTVSLSHPSRSAICSGGSSTSSARSPARRG